VTNVVDERKYKEEAKLRELAQRHQQSPLRFIAERKRSKDSPYHLSSNDDLVLAFLFFSGVFCCCFTKAVG
jgi:hypothetical protein